MTSIPTPQTPQTPPQTPAPRFLDRYAEAVKLWEFTLPEISLPPRVTLIGWLAVYSDDEFDKAVTRTPYWLTQKFDRRDRQLVNEDVYRFISAVLKEGRRAQHKAAQKADLRDADAQAVRSFDGRQYQHQHQHHAGVPGEGKTATMLRVAHDMNLEEADISGSGRPDDTT